MIILSDFISNELVTIKVFDKTYKIKEMNGREYDLMNNESMKYNQELNSFDLDLGVKNIHYLKLVKETPYAEINSLDSNARIEKLNELKQSIRRELLKQIKIVIDSEGDAEKK